MGKDWDKAVPPVAIWRELLRTLKAGSFAFVMSAPRQDVLSRMVVNLQDAGFRTDFTPIYWAYASGFPKAMNISKAVDKKLGVQRNIVGLSDALKGRKSDNKECYVRHVENQKVNAYSDGYPITVPASPEAKALDGSFGGFQPKPAVEVILVAMKPLGEKTFVAQALANGKGITWLDDCRIPFQSDVDKEQAHNNALGPVERFKPTKKIYDGGKQNGGFDDTFNDSGRFPANLLCSDDCLNDGKARKSGTIEAHHVIDKQKTTAIYGEYTNLPAGQQTTYGDCGDFSRYFSLDAWFTDRIKRLPLEVQRTFPFLIEPKASKDERNKNLERLPTQEVFRAGHGNKEQDDVTKRFRTEMKNKHPCVKPLQLMSYLITLGSRPNDLIIDPFCGSGTTCLAAKMLGRQFIGIELNAEYVEIAEKRVGNHRTLFEFASVEPLQVASYDDREMIK